ncbi:protein LYK2 [Spinacia oleracea]|uniref:Protein LYK2 n=1 Tax=Spinacia oleracea TaxID=3562 RepID=A0A9R0IFQ6_SPIOL|nr:protein LYK2 [Spinacia oleracea]
MAALITKLFFLFFFFLVFVPILAHNNRLISCENDSFESLNYGCNRIASENQCTTYAVLHTNPYYSSLYNLTYYLGLNRFTVAEVNGFSPDTEFLSRNQPLLIPVDCRCAEKGRVFQAELIKTTAVGESFSGIADSLEGLTTCKAIREKNAGVSPWDLLERIKISVPVRCACPTSSEISSGIRLLVSYAVTAGDSVSSLALQFNTTVQSIISANKRVIGGGGDLVIRDHSLSVLIPLKQKPLIGSLAKPREPGLGFPSERSVKAIARKKKKKKKMLKLGVSIGVVGFVVLAAIVGFSALFFMQRKEKQQQNCLSSKMVDTELQQLSLSIRTTSEKKVSFEGSQSTLDGHGEATTPRSINKMMLESYTVEELQKATENFDCHNLVEGKIYHGRIKGKDLAIKCTTLELISKVDLTLFQDAIHNHPNIMRVLGTCIMDENDSYLVFEYAKNGSLKDWIHCGLAMKSHFIASCSCFLTWKQRLRICLDVALALQYMHHIMHPVYVHRNIKSKNIFLDEEFNAKVGNFGMAKCVEDRTKEEETDEIQFSSRNPSSWDKGYLAPEYIKQGTISPSIDVYAYGVILLEMLSGETPVISPNHEGETVMISEKIKSILESENVDMLRGWMDKDLGENYSFDGAIALATLARACIDEDVSLRPSAGELVEKLSRLIEESPEQGEQTCLINESSSKPLVQAAVNNSSNT